MSSKTGSVPGAKFARKRGLDALERREKKARTNKAQAVDSHPPANVAPSEPSSGRSGGEGLIMSLELPLHVQFVRSCKAMGMLTVA